MMMPDVAPGTTLVAASRGGGGGDIAGIAQTDAKECLLHLRHNDEENAGRR